MSRRERREMVFLLLFCADMRSEEELPAQIDQFFSALEEEYYDEERLKADMEERAYEETELPTYLTEGRELVREKTLRIAKHIPELDKRLAERMTGWKPERVGAVERTLLRLALYEMLYEEDISAAIAINEAVELAKKYGQEKSGEFVNGVLARFAK